MLWTWSKIHFSHQTIDICFSQISHARSIRNNNMDLLKVLILAGGHSSRMGSPKHLLPLPDGPLYIQLIRILHDALPETDTVHISIATRSDLDDTLRSGIIHLSSKNASNSTSLKLELIADDTEQDIGPAAGLLAAHRTDSAATWLVIACDYPLLEGAAVHQLVKSYTAPATCFKNAEGFSEPLLGIWSPQAFQTLSENVSSGRLGPSYTLRRLDSKLIAPMQEEWLTNVNTKEEWDAAKACMQKDYSEDGL
jgi:molybdopterin-guanine dinucleotide biosynthesis protein A